MIYITGANGWLGLNLVDTIILIGDFKLDLKNVKFIKRGTNMHVEFEYLNHVSNSLVANQSKIQGLNKDSLRGFKGFIEDSRIQVEDSRIQLEDSGIQFEDSRVQLRIQKDSLEGSRIPN